MACYNLIDCSPFTIISATLVYKSVVRLADNISVCKQGAYNGECGMQIAGLRRKCGLHI